MIVSVDDLTRIMNNVMELYLKPKFVELGMNATGEWLNSLEIDTEDNKGIIKGKPYTQQLVRGRAGGSRPPIEPLRRWAMAKFGQGYQEATSIAFAVAKKIEREGTDYYPQGTDLLEILDSAEVKDYINKELTFCLLRDTQIEIKRILTETF